MPKGQFNDLLEIFRVLSEFDDTTNVKQRAFINYEAINTFRSIRSKFLIDNLNNANENHDDFSLRLCELIDKQKFFNVHDVKFVKLKKSVKPFKIIWNVNDYCDNELAIILIILIFKKLYDVLLRKINFF